MNYLGAWAAVAAFAIIAALLVGRRAGYALILAVILLVVLTGYSRFGFGKSAPGGGSTPAI